MLAATTQSRRAGVVFSAAVCLATLAGSSSAALAGTAKEPAVLAVRSTALAQEQAIAVQAVNEAVTRAGWMLTSRTFTPQEAEELVKCLSVDQPWPCLTKSVRDAAVRRLAVLSLESQPTADGTPMTVVTVQIASADQQDTAHGERRYCQPCSPDSLAKLTKAAAEEVLERMYLRSGTTFLEVRSQPIGAVVSVDGELKGVTDVAFPILPGRHRIEVTLPEHGAETRTVDIEGGKTALVIVGFGAKPARSVQDPPPPPRPSRLLPVSLLAGGALLVAGGTVAFLADEDAADAPPNPGPSQPQSYRDTATLGISLIAAGAAVVGVGGWLWWRGSAAARTQGKPAAALMVHPGGAAVSISSPF